jgi:hypothetical protein
MEHMTSMISLSSWGRQTVLLEARAVEQWPFLCCLQQGSSFFSHYQEIGFFSFLAVLGSILGRLPLWRLRSASL